MIDEPTYIRIPAGRPVLRTNAQPDQTHQVYGTELLTGTLSATMRVITPVHVGTGDLALVGQLTPRPENPDDVPLVAPFFREGNLLAIPGSTLKGAFRHLFEAITFSCLAQANTNERQGGQALEGDMRELRGCSYRADRRGGSEGSIRLCPACHVFGGQGFLGKVAFRSAVVLGDQVSRIDFAPQRWGPKLRSSDAARRKLYTHRISSDALVEPVEVLPARTELRLSFDFVNLYSDELGLLLMILGQAPTAPIYPKIGALKAHGFGAVQITLEALWRDDTESYMSYEAQGEDIQAQIGDMVTAAQAARRFYKDGWQAIIRELGSRPEEF